MPQNNIAVIDIGSNSVRYMLYNDQIIVNKKQVNSAVLAEGLATSGTLNNDAILRAANAVSDYVLQAKKSGATSIFIFATEAVRAAKNSANFTDLVFSKTNIAVDVISGALEAQIGFSGATSNCKNASTIIDVGGASVEIISGCKGKIAYSKSLPLGLIRLLDLCGSNRQKIREYIRAKIVDFGAVPHTNNIIAIGGTATSVASINLGQTQYNAQEIHSSIVTLASLKALEDKIYNSKNITADFVTLSANRARIIGHGVIMLQELLIYLGATKLSVSELDNMEGYIKYKNSNQLSL